jgi:hypothetical protein
MPARDPEARRSPLDRSLAPQWILRPSAHFGAAGASAPIVARPAPGPVHRAPRPWRSKQQVSTRVAAVSAWVGVIAALVLPIAFWHHSIAGVAGRFRLDLGYLITGWSGYALLAAGLVMMLPAALAAGTSPDSRLRLRHRGAYLSWGIVLYILGLALASQVAALTG